MQPLIVNPVSMSSRIDRRGYRPDRLPHLTLLSNLHNRSCPQENLRDASTDDGPPVGPRPRGSDAWPTRARDVQTQPVEAFSSKEDESKMNNAVQAGTWLVPAEVVS